MKEPPATLLNDLMFEYWESDGFKGESPIVKQAAAQVIVRELMKVLEALKDSPVLISHQKALEEFHGKFTL